MPDSVSHAEIVRRIQALEADRATKDALLEVAKKLDDMSREIHSLRNTGIGFLASLVIALLVAIITLLSNT